MGRGTPRCRFPYRTWLRRDPPRRGSPCVFRRLGAGRGAQRHAADPPNGPVVAVRKNFSGQLAEGANATFDVVVVKPDGTRLANRNVAWSLYKVERRYQWYNSDGRWGYEPVKSTRRVSDGRADMEQQTPRGFPLRRMGNLSSRLSAADLGETGTDQCVVHGRLVRRPDRRYAGSSRYGLDKASYRSGDTMRVHLNPRLPARRRLRLSATACMTSVWSTWRRPVRM